MKQHTKPKKDKRFSAYGFVEIISLTQVGFIGVSLSSFWQLLTMNLTRTNDRPNT